MRAAKLPSADRVIRPRVSAADAVFLLENGARMDQPTFHALYQRTPRGFNAELIGGVVYVMPSPVSTQHAYPHARLVTWLGVYSARTPGTESADNPTSVLGEESEPQPDAALLIRAECGGGTRLDAKGYVIGPPELVAEVANSTASIDLGAKKADYDAAGAREYLVILARERRVVWYVREGSGAFTEQTPGRRGLLTSAVFPGLQLTSRAFFARDGGPLLAVLDAGLASPEHAAFVAELATRKKTAPKKPRKSK